MVVRYASINLLVSLHVCMCGEYLLWNSVPYNYSRKCVPLIHLLYIKIANCADTYVYINCKNYHTRVLLAKPIARNWLKYFGGLSSQTTLLTSLASLFPSL